MKPAIKKTWIKALRNGKYKQGHGMLCDVHGRMCCLGVLADVALEADWVFTDSDMWALDDGSDRVTSSLSVAQLNKLGLTADQRNALICMNDIFHYSFDDIADYLEKNKEI